MAINIFKSNNCFIACEELSNKEAFYTGIRTGSIVSAVQQSAFDVSIDRTSSKQIGSPTYAVNSPFRQPDVSLTFSYIQTWPYLNEGFVNLADLNNEPLSSFDEIPMVPVLSGYETASRNFYIFSRVGASARDAFTGFKEGDSPDFTGYQCASVGNCYLTKYSLSYSIGNLAQVSAAFVGSNMQYTDVTGTRVISPAINLTSGNANEVGELTFDGLREFAPNPVVMNPSDTGSVLSLQNLQVGGQSFSGEHLIQSADLSLDISRIPSYGLGSDYPYERKMELPVKGNVNFNSKVSGWTTGFISGILDSDSSYSFDLTLEGSGKSITYKIEDARLQSYNYEMGVNQLMDFNAAFTFEVSPNPKGLQISGDPQQSLAQYATNQIDTRINDSMDIATNGYMLVDFTDPNGVLEGGGYGAARSGDFWASDIDYTAVSVWNNRGDFTPKDYRMRGATAITKRHVVMAKHYWLAVGNKLWFVAADGTWIEREVLQTSSHGSSDIAVALLNSDLPSTITPVKVVPSNFETYFKREAGGAISLNFRPIIVGFDFEKKGLLMQLTRAVNGSNEATFAAGNLLIPSPYNVLSETLDIGDSGNPLFIIIGGEAVLIGLFETSSNVPAYSKYISTINGLISTVDSAEGISTGYTLQEKNLSSLNLKRYAPL